MSPSLQATGLILPGRLKETSIELHAGELTCLIGPNGSGKTSLLHALAGIGYPHGKVCVDGLNPHVLPPSQRQQLISYLPASRDVNWPLTARDVVALGSPAGKDDRRIEELLTELDLQSFASRRIDRMSTGERSRVLIARALVTEPKALLLDEPAANLDPYWQLRLMAYLRQSARENQQALLVAVHDLELARSYADRLIIMDRGGIVADGEPHALLASEWMPQVFRIMPAGGGWQPVA